MHSKLDLVSHYIAQDVSAGKMVAEPALSINRKLTALIPLNPFRFHLIVDLQALLGDNINDAVDTQSCLLE